MIVVVEPYNEHKYSRLMDEMFRLRARIFHDLAEARRCGVNQHGAQLRVVALAGRELLPAGLVDHHQPAEK